MTEFETSLNQLLVNTLNYMLKYEEISLKSLAPVAVTVSEAHVIEAIAELGDEAAVCEIAERLGVAMPTATVSVKRLVGKGLVEKRQSAEDGRRSAITLTAAGARINRAHRLFHRKMIRDCSRDLSEQEREALLTAVQKLSGFFAARLGGIS